LDASIIYPIFDSKWVSPIHVVSKGWSDGRREQGW